MPRSRCHTFKVKVLPPIPMTTVLSTDTLIVFYCVLTSWCTDKTSMLVQTSLLSHGFRCCPLLLKKDGGYITPIQVMRKKKWRQNSLRDYGFDGGHPMLMGFSGFVPGVEDPKILCLVRGMKVWRSQLWVSSKPESKFNVRFATDGTLGVFVERKLVAEELPGGFFPDPASADDHVERLFSARNDKKKSNTDYACVHA